MDAAALFEKTMDWLRDSYGEHRFFVERDVVWTAQLRLLRELDDANLPYRVLTEYKIRKGAPGIDLVIMDESRIMSGSDGSVLVAIELKYEPHRSRLPSTQARVIWSEVETDIRKVQEYVGKGGVGAAYAILVDADGRWRSSHPNAPKGSEWRDWGNGVSALWTKVDAGAAYKTPPAGGAPDALSSGEPRQVTAHGEWVPLPDLDVNLPAYPPPPSRLRFSDDNERPVNAWKDLLFGVASWLASVGKLTERDAPVPVDARQPQTRQRYIVSADQVHGSDKPFEEPFEIPGAPLAVETMVDKTQAKSHAIKLLEHCEVDPGSVFVLR